MVEVPDYRFISADTGPSLSQSIGNWQGITKNALDIQDKQAEQAIGGILQQSTDAQGNVDYGTANALAAKAGPVVQMRMQTMLQANSARRGEQITQGAAANTQITRAGASLMQDSSDANVNATFDNLIATNPGQRQLYEAERQRVLAMREPQQRVQYAYQHVLGQLDAADQLLRGGYGAPVMTTFGGSSAPVVSTPGSPYGPARTAVGGGIAHTVDPGTYYGSRSAPIMYDANGQVTTDPTKAVTKVDRDVPAGPAMGMPPPGTVGGPGGGGAGQGAPASGLPPGAPPPPTGTKLQGGRFVQPPPASPAPSPAPPPSTPAAPAPAPAPTGGVVTGLPTGTEKTTEAAQQADQKQFIADRTALPQRQTQEQNLQHAYEALKLVTSGRGTETASSLRNLLVTAGVAGAATANDEALYEIGRKYTERTIADAGNAGGTDTARVVAAASNPNVSLINPANLAFLRNDIGKVRQQMAAYMTAPDTTIGKGFGKHSADIASTTDYRGFNWDMYSQAEQKEIEKSVGKEGTPAHDALARAIGMGRALWPQKAGPGPIVPHAAVMPAGPPPNALAMVQSQGNALLAA